LLLITPLPAAHLPGMTKATAADIASSIFFISHVRRRLSRAYKEVHPGTYCTNVIG